MQMANLNLDRVAYFFRWEDDHQFYSQIHKQVDIAFVEKVEEKVGNECINDEAEPLGCSHLSCLMDSN